MSQLANHTSLSLDEIEALAERVFVANGCDAANAAALTRTVVAAERDGSRSHGAFRIPGYVASLRSGKVNGQANPTIERATDAAILLDGDRGFAPLALERGIPVLADAARSCGIAILSIRASYHFAALWHETEALAERGLIGLACVNSPAVVAPFGGHDPIFGTNPLSFAWPRPGDTPVVFDMATAAMAQGEIQIAAREARTVPDGTGLDAEGRPSTDPDAILEGVQLPFGAHKGSAIALMVELFAAGLTGEFFSYEASNDVADGGPAKGGEIVIAIDPGHVAGSSWAQRSEAFFDRFAAIDGARLPGLRRHEQRQDRGPRSIDTTLLEQIRALARTDVA